MKKIGRPVGKRNLKDELLKASLQILGEKDFDSVSISEITNKCGTTRAMFHYYFGSKDNLQTIFIKEFLMPRIIDITNTLYEYDNVYNGLDAVQNKIIDMVKDNPDIIKFWARNVILNNSFLENTLENIGIDRFQKFIGSIKAGQDRKEINDKLQPFMIYFSLLTTTIMAFIDFAPLNIYTMEEKIKHIKSFVMRGIRYEE